MIKMKIMKKNKIYNLKSLQKARNKLKTEIKETDLLIESGINFLENIISIVKKKKSFNANSTEDILNDISKGFVNKLFKNSKKENLTELFLFGLTNGIMAILMRKINKKLKKDD